MSQDPDDRTDEEMDFDNMEELGLEGDMDFDGKMETKWRSKKDD